MVTCCKRGSVGALCCQLFVFVKWYILYTEIETKMLPLAANTTYVIGDRNSQVIQVFHSHLILIPSYYNIQY